MGLLPSLPIRCTALWKQRVLLSLLAFLAIGCKSGRKRNALPEPLTEAQVLTPSTPAPSQKKASAPDPRDTSGRHEGPEAAQTNGQWHKGTRRKVGPAGPIAATPSGVLFVTRDNRLLRAKRKGVDDFVPLSEKPSSFASFGRGPATSSSHAYWASEHGELFRGNIENGRVELLVKGVRSNTRASVIRYMGRDIVAFIREVDAQPLAFLWSTLGEGRSELLRVSPEGSTASSVVLLPGSPHPRILVLAGRFGMSPVHVRQLRVGRTQIHLKADEVVWVGPGSNSFTELYALRRSGGEVAAFLPTAKDFNDFGLAQLSIHSGGGEIAEPKWRIYPNGLDPAPVATGHFCGSDQLLYARPKEQSPSSSQELHLASITDSMPGEGEVIAQARRFNDLSLVSTKEGAIVAWTAGSATRALVLTCLQSTEDIEGESAPEHTKQH